MAWLERNGVSLFYEDAPREAARDAPRETPKDAPALVLVHGLGCDHSFMAPQLDAFRGTPSGYGRRLARARAQ